MTTTAVSTGQPVVSGGIESPVFFNGRLLTGEDLTREQMANETARRRLGQLAGTGVSCGFRVSDVTAAAAPPAVAQPVLHITGGRTVNGDGCLLELAAPIDLALTRDTTSESGAGATFADCTPMQPGTYVAGAGVYILTVAPASQGVGRAPVNGLDSANAVCNVAYSVSGVQFHLLRVGLPPGIDAHPLQLRNRLAHLMAGTDARESALFQIDPWGTSVGGYGMLDDLRDAGCLTPDQVPIALLQWTLSDGVTFVDEWAVRRRLVAPAADTSYGLLTGDRKRAHAEALFEQFQAQVMDDWHSATSTDPLSAQTADLRFAYLPPVGLVPIDGPASTGGYDPDLFLGAQASSTMESLEAADLRRLIQDGYDADPVLVGGDETFQRYLVRDNEQAVGAGLGVTRVMVFARRSLGHRGTARFGRARFGFSRVGPSVS